MLNKSSPIYKLYIPSSTTITNPCDPNNFDINYDITKDNLFENWNSIKISNLLNSIDFTIKSYINNTCIAEYNNVTYTMIFGISKFIILYINCINKFIEIYSYEDLIKNLNHYSSSL